MAADVVTTAAAGLRESNVTVSPAAMRATLAAPPDEVAKRFVTPSYAVEPPTQNKLAIKPS